MIPLLHPTHTCTALKFLKGQGDQVQPGVHPRTEGEGQRERERNRDIGSQSLHGARRPSIEPPEPLGSQGDVLSSNVQTFCSLSQQTPFDTRVPQTFSDAQLARVASARFPQRANTRVRVSCRWVPSCVAALTHKANKQTTAGMSIHLVFPRS